MKTNKLLLTIFFVTSLFFLQGCEDDIIEVNSVPEFTTIEDAISSLPNLTFTLTAAISDPAGIKSVNIKYGDWFLDKTIVKDSLPKNYTLAYNFRVPATAIENSIHTIEITATNAGDKTTTRNVVVTLNKDITAPVINNASPVNGSTVLISNANEIDFNINFTDNRGLAEFKIEGSLLNFTQTITGTTFNYTNSLNVDNPGKYTFVVSAKDTSGNESRQTIEVNVLRELLFDNMYITDVTDPALLTSDIFGIPYATDASTIAAEDGYVFTARYYAASANSQVRFLPQKQSFSPYTFGADPSNPSKLVLGTDQSVSPIILPNIGYYQIKMDLRDNSILVTPYTPADTPFAQVYIIGRGVFISDTVSTCTNNVTGATTCWHFNSGKPFTQNGNNPYLWTINVTLRDQPNDNGENGFILNANPRGWSPFWRLDRQNDPEATVPNAGINYVFPEAALNNDYTFIFDTHLNRIAAIRR